MPDWIFNHPKLRALVSHSFKIPAIPKSIGRITQREHLSLQGCRLASIPESFENLHNMKRTESMANNLRTIPAVILKLGTLGILLLTGSFIASPLPDELFAMDIKRPDYQLQPSASGAMPTPEVNAIDKAAMLEILSELPKHHESWKAETPLSEWKNLIVKKIDGEMHVTWLMIENAQGKLSPAIGKLRFLEGLGFRRSDIQGEFPEELGNLENLERLEIDQVENMAGFLPESIGNLRSLKTLKLKALPLTALPKSLGNLSNLREFEISNCPISELPESIGNLPALRDLSIFDAPITSLPESVGNLAKLSHLTLVRCKLEKIPPVVGKLTGLIYLALGSNEISGPLPDFLFELPIEILYLQENRFSGSIPKAICKLPLRNLVLRDNLLTGKVPSCLKEREFYIIDFDGNDLTMDAESKAVFDKVRFDKVHAFLRYREKPAEDDSGCKGPSVTLYGATAPFKLCDGYGGAGWQRDEWQRDEWPNKELQSKEWQSKDRRANFWGDIQRLYVGFFFEEPCSAEKLKKLLPKLQPAMDEAMRKAEALPREEIITTVAAGLYDIMRQEVDANNAKIKDPKRKIFLPEREKLGDIFFTTSINPYFFIDKNGALNHVINISFQTYEYYLGGVYLDAYIVDGKLVGGMPALAPKIG